MARRTISSAERWHVYRWLDRMSYEEAWSLTTAQIAERCASDVHVEITPSIAETARRDVHPRREISLTAILDRLDALEARLL